MWRYSKGFEKMLIAKNLISLESYILHAGLHIKIHLYLPILFKD